MTSALVRCADLILVSGTHISAIVGLVLMIAGSLVRHISLLAVGATESLVYAALEAEFQGGGNLTLVALIMSGVLFQMFLSESQLQKDVGLVLQPVERVHIYGCRLLLDLLMVLAYFVYVMGFYSYLSVTLSDPEFLGFGLAVVVVGSCLVFMVHAIVFLLTVLPIDDMQKGALLVILAIFCVSPPVGTGGVSLTLLMFLAPAIVGLLPSAVVESLEQATGTTLEPTLLPLVSIVLLFGLACIVYVSVLRRREFP